jgi:hypothetical protein
MEDGLILEQQESGIHVERDEGKKGSKLETNGNMTYLKSSAQRVA